MRIELPRLGPGAFVEVDVREPTVAEFFDGCPEAAGKFGPLTLEQRRVIDAWQNALLARCGLDVSELAADRNDLVTGVFRAWGWSDGAPMPPAFAIRMLREQSGSPVARPSELLRLPIGEFLFDRRVFAHADEQPKRQGRVIAMNDPGVPDEVAATDEA